MPPENREVLTHLPDTRPTRRSPKRQSGTTAKAKAVALAGPKPSAERKTASTAKPKAKPSTRVAAKTPAGPAAAPAARPRGAKVRTPKGQVAPTAARQPAVVDDGPVPAAGWAVAEPKPAAGRMNTDELMHTTARAITEIIGIGLESFRESIGSVLGRLPRP